MRTRYHIVTTALLLIGVINCVAAAQDLPSLDCPVTLVNDRQGGMHANDAIEVGLPPEGRFIFKPGGPGFIAVSDGALGMKMGWNRLKKGHVRIEGRRLDGAAPPLRAHVPPYGDIGFQASSVIFPTTGCWEVTGRLGERSLTFVVSVAKIGDGPAWRRDL